MGAWKEGSRGPFLSSHGAAWPPELEQESPESRNQEGREPEPRRPPSLFSGTAWPPELGVGGVPGAGKHGVGRPTFSLLTERHGRRSWSRGAPRAGRKGWGTPVLSVLTERRGRRSWSRGAPRAGRKGWGTPVLSSHGTAWPPELE
jgi:hypothetical protein